VFLTVKASIHGTMVLGMWGCGEWDLKRVLECMKIYLGIDIEEIGDEARKLDLERRVE